MENKLTPELIEKAKQAKSAEELLALAKENEIELSEEEAKVYFEQISKSGELSDEELDNVSGGGCYKDDYLVVTPHYNCYEWRCKNCGLAENATYSIFIDGKWRHCEDHSFHCSGCKYYGKKAGLLICTNPQKMKK